MTIYWLELFVIRAFTEHHPCMCPCVHSRDGPCQYMSSCYVPACPPGTYMCCVTCIFSSCKRNSVLLKSTRGVHECIPCPAGHFCEGCDLPERCPDDSIAAQSGNSGASDCEPCNVGFFASSDRTRCCTADGNCQTSDIPAYNYLVNIEMVPNTSLVYNSRFGISILVINMLLVYVFSQRFPTVT